MQNLKSCLEAHQEYVDKVNFKANLCHSGDEDIMMLEPGSSATVPLQSIVSASCQSQLASCPELFFDTDPVSAMTVSGSMAALQKAINGR